MTHPTQASQRAEMPRIGSRLRQHAKPPAQLTPGQVVSIMSSCRLVNGGAEGTFAGQQRYPATHSAKPRGGGFWTTFDGARLPCTLSEWRTCTPDSSGPCPARPVPAVPTHVWRRPLARRTGYVPHGRSPDHLKLDPAPMGRTTHQRQPWFRYHILLRMHRSVPVLPELPHQPTRLWRPSNR